MHTLNGCVDVVEAERKKSRSSKPIPPTAANPQRHKRSRGQRTRQHSRDSVWAAATEAVGGEGEERLVVAARLRVAKRAGRQACRKKQARMETAIFMTREVVLGRETCSGWYGMVLWLAFLAVAFLGSCARTHCSKSPAVKINGDSRSLCTTESSPLQKRDANDRSRGMSPPPSWQPCCQRTV